MVWGFDQQKRKRVLYEDALKHIYQSEDLGGKASLLSLAGAMNLSQNKVLELVSELEDNFLIKVTADHIELTSQGESWALHVVRAHRLWEQYLSDRVGVPLEELHQRAEEKEHSITPEQADDIARELGYPSFDPHGDPIPSAEHEFPQKKRKGIPLNEWPLDRLGAITHIEDEPESIYAQILGEGLVLGANIKVLKNEDSGILIWSRLHECWLAPIVASNIYIAPATHVDEDIHLQPLSRLPVGKHALVVGIQSHGLTKRRLMDLGLTDGANVEVVFKSPLGEPIAYRVRGALIALRRNQAKQVIVKEIGHVR